MKAGLTIIVIGLAMNGHEEQPAIITKVWNRDEEKGTAFVNAKVFPDFGQVVDQGSFTVYPTEAAAREARAAAIASIDNPVPEGSTGPVVGYIA